MIAFFAGQRPSFDGFFYGINFSVLALAIFAGIVAEQNFNLGNRATLFVLQKIINIVSIQITRFYNNTKNPALAGLPYFLFKQITFFCD